MISNVSSFLHVWISGLLQASRGVICANNRDVAFALFLAYLGLVDTIFQTHVGHESDHVHSKKFW